MNYHRWVSGCGFEMTAVDVTAYKNHRARQAIKRIWQAIYRRLTLVNSSTQVFAAIAALPALPIMAFA